MFKYLVIGNGIFFGFFAISYLLTNDVNDIYWMAANGIAFCMNKDVFENEK